MGQIVILGLGPGRPEYLTREAWTLLEQVDELWLRTAHHPTVSGLPAGLIWHAFDALYQDAEDFDHVYEAITKEIIRLAGRPDGVAYAVPGHPLVGESTVTAILAAARSSGIPVRIVGGMSFIEPVLTALGVDAMAGLQIHDALEVAVAHCPPLTPDVAALVGQLYSRALAADVKLTLMNQYPDEHEVVLISSAGEKTQRVTTIPLYELDRQADVDHLTSLYIPALIEATSLCALQETVAHLRAPDGCPWDREQTHQSLRSDLLEETYETLEAIESGSQESLCEELGDLLLQIVLHAQIATEEGEFQMWQVISGLVAKLKHRHPHVWGEQVVSGTDEVLQRWDELKREERGPERRSVLDGVPRTLPALQQADTVGRRVARVGFDWSDIAGVTDKIYEEMDELVSADTPETQEAELGDLLFAVVNWARWLDIDPEAALRGATGRFVSRFRQVERIADEQSLALASMSIDELETLWQRVKGMS